jgi:hypothetical protein
MKQKAFFYVLYNDELIRRNRTSLKTADIVRWLKEDFDLGHVHSMAVYSLFKGIKDEPRR